MRWLIIAVSASIAGAVSIVLMVGNKEREIPSTRFGIVDCSRISQQGELCVVKDDSTKQRYLVCIHCEVQEYRRKK